MKKYSYKQLSEQTREAVKILLSVVTIIGLSGVGMMLLANYMLSGLPNEVANTQSLTSTEKHIYSPEQLRTRVSCQRLEVTGTTPKKLGSVWENNGFLWKPTAEHYDGVAVATLPLNAVTKVSVLNSTKHFIKFLPFRSNGVAGTVFADYKLPGAGYQKKYGTIFVQLTYAGKRNTKRTFELSCPSQRSDGR